MAHPRAFLVLVTHFADTEPSNFVLECRTLQSEPFGGSPLTCYTSRGSSQGLNDHAAFGLPEARGRFHRNDRVGTGVEGRNRHLELFTARDDHSALDEVG